MNRKFLFLQGPHGPFFAQLASMLVKADIEVKRVNFNGGDSYYWDHALSFVDFTDDIANWPDALERLCEKDAITDIVLYGDMRPIHRAAISIAKARQINIHCFEEGYLRPYWVTYERGGVNGNSPLMNISFDDIQKKRLQRTIELQDAPMRWGNLWQHNWYGFMFHLRLWLARKHFPNYRPHRNITIERELRLNFIRLLQMPMRIFEREFQTWRFLRSGSPFFVALLQLDHDSSFQNHSDFDDQIHFLNELLENFAKFAPKYYHLILKLHPLDDGRQPLKKRVELLGKQLNIKGRVHLIYGGKLSDLLSRARATVTVNSSASQHSLWRGIPTKFLGRSIYNKPEIASQQSLENFFQAPNNPSKHNYREFRTFLLETSQIGGGFYAQSARAEILRVAVEMLLHSEHPYEN